jgi:hypothetical protein
MGRQLRAQSNALETDATEQSLVQNNQFNALKQFTSELDSILSTTPQQAQEEFTSFTINGPKVPRKTKRMNEAQIQAVAQKKEQLRGCIRQVSGRLILLSKKKKGKKQSKTTKDDAQTLFLQVTFKYHSATDVAQNYNIPETDETSTIGSELLKAILPRQEEDDTGVVQSEWGKGNQSADFGIVSGDIITSKGSWKLNLTTTSKKKDATFKFIPTKTQKSSDTTPKVVLTHDVKKQVLLSPSDAYFQKLGVSDVHGKPKRGMASKLRQCQKFVEIVSRLVDQSGVLTRLTTEQEQSSESSHDPPVLKTMDMGCGRGYLTFSLHSHLVEKSKDSTIQVESRGIDVRPKLVAEINDIATELGPEFEGLRFTTGNIMDAGDKGRSEDDLDILIALHACDTATDDSIWYGIRTNANIIVTAPCCHKEVRRSLDRFVATNDEMQSHPYKNILRHNIYKERIAETVTDSIRAMLLEIANYDVQVFEFIGGEHTSKNVMITGVKRQTPRTESQMKQLRYQLRELTSLHGILHQKLARWMGERLVEEENEDIIISRTGMPSL